MSSDLIPKRALLPPKQSQSSSSSYTETKAQRANNLAFDTQSPKSKAAKAASKRKHCRVRLFCEVSRVLTIALLAPAKEFDSSVVVSPLLDPRILERRVMAAKAGDRER